MACGCASPRPFTAPPAGGTQTYLALPAGARAPLAEDNADAVESGDDEPSDSSIPKRVEVPVASEPANGPTRIADHVPVARKPTSSSSEYRSVRAVIYGASWCAACHMAEDYLRSTGAQVTVKDIERDRRAHDEMRSKLGRAGKRGSQIPVVDVGGVIMVGYNKRAIKSALAKASGR